MSEPWKYAFCDCTSDWDLCCFACCVISGPSILQIFSVDAAINEAFCLTWLVLACGGPCGAAINRTRIRNKLKIQGSIFSDYCTWYWCPICASVQEGREVRDKKTMH